MKRRQFLGGLTLTGLARAADNAPEKKAFFGSLDLQRKMDDTLAGRRPPEPILAYPYFSPDYKLPFTHIGTEKQLFLDNFILEYLDGVERVIGKPRKRPSR